MCEGKTRKTDKKIKTEYFSGRERILEMVLELVSNILVLFIVGNTGKGRYNGVLDFKVYDVIITSLVKNAKNLT